MLILKLYMLLTYYFLNILFIGNFFWKVNIWESIRSLLVIAICLASCALMITSLFGRQQDVFQENSISWFEANHFCVRYILFQLKKFQGKFIQALSTGLRSNAQICENSCDWLKLNDLQIIILCVVAWVNGV